MDDRVVAERHVDAQDVGIIFQGNYVAPVAGPDVVIQLETFKRITRIDASWPASIGISKLLEHDITAKKIARVWGNELTFEGSQFRLRIYKFSPALWWTAFITMMLCGAALVLSTILYPKVTSIAWLWLAAFVMSAVVSVYFTAAIHLPYMICKRLQPLIEQVNIGLPELIDKRRAQLRN